MKTVPMKIAGFACATRYLGVSFSLCSYMIAAMNNALLTTVSQLLPFVSLIVSNCITAVTFCITDC